MNFGMAVTVEMHNHWLRGLRQRNRPQRVQWGVALLSAPQPYLSCYQREIDTGFTRVSFGST
jgi:hypothetical protein